MKNKINAENEIYVKMVDTKSGETIHQYKTNSSEFLKDEGDDFVYILITNYNTADFQSFIVRYESWEKFKNNFINPTKDKDNVS